MAGTMGLPPTENFEYYVGDSGSFAIELTDAEQSPYDLTGFTSKFVVADSVSQNPAWSIVCDSVISGNSIICSITPEDGLEIGTKGARVFYDVEITNGTLVQTVLRGEIAPKIGVHEMVGP